MFHLICVCLALYGHIKTAEPQTIIQQYGDLIGTLAVDGWTVTFGTVRMGLSRLQLRPHCITAHPLMTSVPTLMWHYNCLCTLKG